MLVFQRQMYKLSELSNPEIKLFTPVTKIGDLWEIFQTYFLAQILILPFVWSILLIFEEKTIVTICVVMSFVERLRYEVSKYKCFGWTMDTQVNVVCF